MEFPKKSCPAGRKRVTLGRFRNAILKEKLQMNMKNIIKNKQKELMQGMIALILCVALFCSAAVSGKNDGSEWKMRHGGQKYKETGPKSWAERRAWSGEWSNQYVRGNYFGNFGCGLCCMANIYCTLTEHTCSPWDMYEYARQVSGYAPSRKIGAIGWADMKVTLRKSGFDCTLNTKPESTGLCGGTESVDA